LRALISRKTDPLSAKGGEGGQGDSTVDSSLGPLSIFTSTFGGSQGGNGDTLSALDDFHFESEMGPVADMSTFPPTMATNTSDDNIGMLSMDSILSSGFWDSVLVPGELHLVD
jgi:hypothetical protein